MGTTDPMDALAEMSSVDLRESVRIRWNIEMCCPVCGRAILGHEKVEADRCLIQLGQRRKAEA